MQFPPTIFHLVTSCLLTSTAYREWMPSYMTSEPLFLSRHSFIEQRLQLYHNPIRPIIPPFSSPSYRPLELPSTSLKSVKSTAFTRWKSQHPRPHTSQLRHRSQTLAFTIPLQHQAGGLRRRYPLLTGRHCLPTAVNIKNHGES